MDQKASALNPYAPSYIPVSRRRTVDQNLSAEPTREDFQSHYVPAQSRPLSQQTTEFNVFGIEELLCDSDEAEKRKLDEDSSMVLSCLEMMFPNFSQQSIADVYFGHGSYLDSTLRALNVLEMGNGSPHHLPDSLDVEALPDIDPQVSGTSVAQEASSAGETSGSSGPSDSA